MRWETHRGLFLPLAHTASRREPPGNRFGALPTTMRDECSVMTGEIRSLLPRLPRCIQREWNREAVADRRFISSCDSGFNFPRSTVHARIESNSISSSSWIFNINLGYLNMLWYLIKIAITLIINFREIPAIFLRAIADLTNAAEKKKTWICKYFNIQVRKGEES